MGLEEIAEYKKKLGITTEELSRKSDVPLGTLNKTLKGVIKDPKLEILRAIAKVSGLSLDDLGDGREAEGKPTYNGVTTTCTRSKNNLPQEGKIRLARITLSDNEE